MSLLDKANDSILKKVAKKETIRISYMTITSWHKNTSYGVIFIIP